MSAETTETLETYTVQLIGPGPMAGEPVRNLNYMDLVARVFPEIMKEVEENVNDVLPEGYSVRIRDWDADDD